MGLGSRGGRRERADLLDPKMYEKKPYGSPLVRKLIFKEFQQESLPDGIGG